MKICLVRCPAPFLIDDRMFPPLGLMAVGTGLQQAGHEVSIHDGPLQTLPLDQDAYGFGPTAPEYPMAVETLNRIKRTNRTARVVLGGPHATLNWQTCLKEGWDCVVVGDGEIVSDRAFIGKPTLLMAEERPLDEYPIIDRSLVDLRSYHYASNGVPGTTLVTARGCPHACDFCLPRGTLVLTADLRWVPIETIKTGDTLVGTKKQDAKNTGYTSTYVTELFERKATLLKIVTTKGEVRSSSEHPWLTTHNRWIEAGKLKKGQSLRDVSPALESRKDSPDYIRGYLVGCIEGDGHLKRYSQKNKGSEKIYVHHMFRLVGDYEMLDYFLKYANDLGIGVYHQKFNGGKLYKCNRSVETGKRRDFERIETLFQDERTTEFRRGWLAGFYDAEGGWSGTVRFYNRDNAKLKLVGEYLKEYDFVTVMEKQSIRIKGGNSEAIRFFSLVQPKVRSKKKFLFTNHLKNQAKILSIERIEGEIEVFNLETTSNNFIADGFVTHNCCKNHDRVRLMTAARAIAEIRYLAVDWGYKVLAFPEDIFILDRKRTETICAALKDLGIEWRCLVRSDIVVRRGMDFLHMLKDAGCAAVGIGIESGSEQILQTIHKGESVATILQSVRMLQAAGIRTRGYFVVGLPGENAQTLEETWEFLEEAQLDEIDAKIFQPYPGSPIYEHRDRYDIHWNDTAMDKTFYKGKPGLYEGSLSTSALTTEQIVDAWKAIETRFNPRVTQ